MQQYCSPPAAVGPLLQCSSLPLLGFWLAPDPDKTTALRKGIRNIKKSCDAVFQDHAAHCVWIGKLPV